MIEGEEPFLLIMHHACYYDDDEQDESLVLPFQAMCHGIKFDLTPKDRLKENGEPGTQKMVVQDREIPLTFYGRKMFIKIRRPTPDEMEDLEFYELTSPIGFQPENNTNHEDITTRRKRTDKPYKQYPGGLTMIEWRKRLAMAPDEVIRKTFKATTQMAMSLDIDNRIIPRRHHKARFPFLKQNRINDEFHSDTFFLSVKSNQGHTCSQIFLGKKTHYMSVHPLKKDSHSFVALQDFGRKVGLPNTIKTDNAKTEIGNKWTQWCRN